MPISVVNCGGLAGKWRFGTFVWRENFLRAGRKKARISHFQWTSEIFASCSLWFAVFFKKFKFSNSKFLKLWQFGLKLWRYFSKNFGAGFGSKSGGFWFETVDNTAFFTCRTWCRSSTRRFLNMLRTGKNGNQTAIIETWWKLKMLEEKC